MILRFGWIALAVLIADQLSKYAALTFLPHGGLRVLPILDFTLVHNAGAAFGFLNKAAGWQGAFFIAIAVVVSVAIVVIARRLKREQWLLGVALMLVLGGAIGNLIDRLRFGYVIDFIDFYYQSWHWYVFNVADAAITVGAIILALDAFGLGHGRPAEPRTR